jgi:hypothetical protein
MTKIHHVLLSASAALFLCGHLRGNTILGVFSNPVLAGSVANDPIVGQATYMDNTGTAVSFIDNVNDPTLGGTPPQQQFGNFVLWGTSDASEIDFFGAQIPANPDTPFQIGTFTFTNATSNLNQLVFGFTISFYDTVVGPTSFLGSDQIVITTTQDITGGAPGDDDYVNICGTFSSICNSSIEAVETSEGGTGVTVNLMGAIVGDPTLSISDVSLAAGQNGTTNGFIGSDPAIGADTPEPGTWTTLFGGAVLAAWARIRRRRLP